jgi:hypothetical protein
MVLVVSFLERVAPSTRLLRVVLVPKVVLVVLPKVLVVLPKVLVVVLPAFRRPVIRSLWI